VHCQVPLVQAPYISAKETHTSAKESYCCKISPCGTKTRSLLLPANTVHGEISFMNAPMATFHLCVHTISLQKRPISPQKNPISPQKSASSPDSCHGRHKGFRVYVQTWKAKSLPYTWACEGATACLCVWKTKPKSLWKHVAVVCCSRVLQSRVAMMCCSSVLQSCVVVACCNDVLQ